MRLSGDQKILKQKIREIWNFFQFFPHAGTLEEKNLTLWSSFALLSLRYGADLGRSRLVFNNSAKTPLLLHFKSNIAFY